MPDIIRQDTVFGYMIYILFPFMTKKIVPVDLLPNCLSLSLVHKAL